MTDPDAAVIIDRLMMILSFSDEVPADPELYEDAIGYLIRTSHEHPEFRC